MISTRWIALIFVAALGATDVQAQSYPNKPLRLVLPYAPGGIVDYVGRTLAQHLSGPLKQQVIAENRPGAGGIVGTDTVVRSAPDGYTLVIGDPALVINPTLQPRMPFDLFKQLQVVSFVSASPVVVVVAPQLPVTTIDELIAFGKSQPNRFNFASAGVGTATHLGAELFMQRTGITATHVPYRSIGRSFPDIMMNKVQFAFSSLAGALSFTTDGRVRPIATTGAKRSPVYPELPTVDEAGLKGFEIDLWLAVLAPAGVPADVVTKLNAAIKVTLKNPDVTSAFATVGVEPHSTTPQESAEKLKTEFETWKKVIAEGNIKLQK